MKANEIYSSFMWLINEGLMSELQFRSNMATLENRLKENGIFIGGLTDVEIIDMILKLDK